MPFFRTNLVCSITLYRFQHCILQYQMHSFLVSALFNSCFNTDISALKSGVSDTKAIIDIKTAVFCSYTTVKKSIPKAFFYISRKSISIFSSKVSASEFSVGETSADFSFFSTAVGIEILYSVFSRLSFSEIFFGSAL